MAENKGAVRGHSGSNFAGSGGRELRDVVPRLSLNFRGAGGQSPAAVDRALCYSDHSGAERLRGHLLGQQRREGHRGAQVAAVPARALSARQEVGQAAGRAAGAGRRGQVRHRRQGARRHPPGQARLHHHQARPVAPDG